MNLKGRKRNPNNVSIEGDTATIFIRCKGNLLPCFVDTCDLPLVTPYTWVSSHGRALHRSSIKGEVYAFYMHQLLLNRVGVKDRLVIDHIDRNPLNNRRSNLRVVTETYNNLNVEKPSFTGLRGAYKHSFYGKDCGRYDAYYGQVSVNRKRVTIGYFATPEESNAATMKYLRDHDLIPVTPT